jgi:hypothetical protein
MFNNNYIFFLLFFTISIANGMQSEDFYGNKKDVPILHTYKKIHDTTKHSKERMPFIENFAAIKTVDEQNSFSIKLLKYDNSLLHKEVKYNKRWGILSQDQSIVNSILNNEHTIVITQNKMNKKAVFIPINANNDILSSKTGLLLLALIAGKEHFKTNNATITIKDDEMQIWKKLFEEYQTLIKSNTESHITTPFNLNFKIIHANTNAIQNILILVHSIRENFDIQSTTDTILKSEEENRTKNLNSFLTTGDFLQEEQEKTVPKEEQEKTVPKFSIIFYYTIIKRKISQNFLQPIKRWFDYFYYSYRFYFR